MKSFCFYCGRWRGICFPRAFTPIANKKMKMLLSFPSHVFSLVWFGGNPFGLLTYHFSWYHQSNRLDQYKTPQSLSTYTRKMAIFFKSFPRWPVTLSLFGSATTKCSTKEWFLRFSFWPNQPAELIKNILLLGNQSPNFYSILRKYYR